MCTHVAQISFCNCFLLLTRFPYNNNNNQNKDKQSGAELLACFVLFSKNKIVKYHNVIGFCHLLHSAAHTFKRYTDANLDNEGFITCQNANNYLLKFFLSEQISELLQQDATAGRTQWDHCRAAEQPFIFTGVVRLIVNKDFFLLLVGGKMDDGMRISSRREIKHKCQIWG